MAALINTLDTNSSKQVGENGHLEYRWSNNIQEKILQFSFQLTRTDDAGIQNLEIILIKLLSDIKYIFEKYNSSLPEKEIAKGYLSILYKMIAHTRDIVDGKGEYKLTYMMIYTWYNFFPELSRFALKCLVDLGDISIHQYGSWKDIKYFCDYCKTKGTEQHPLVEYSVDIINNQLRNDYASVISNSNDISLAAKWAPREKSKFGWLFDLLAIDYYKQYIETADNDTRYKKAVLKCKMEYRKLLSLLNKKIDTLQIKQCAHDWSSINFNKVTSISISKQKKALLNLKKNGEVRCPYDLDRINCAENFTTYIKKSIKEGNEIKGKRVGMADFTKEAISLMNYTSNICEIELLNSQWRDSSSLTSSLGNMIAMVDVSGSMEGDPMNVAIALGIRIAEKSVLGKRVMTFTSKPTWVNLEPYDDFVSQVKIIKNAEWGMNTNFHAALNTILDAIIENKMDPNDVQDMVLVVLSDMQIDQGDNSDKNVLYDVMKTKYEEAGIRVHGKPYKPPHILFWNLRSTNGFPSLANQPNVSMMSGFSPALLNVFCEKGVDALQACTPWSLLEQSLENERYKIMGDKLYKEIEI
jgi:hypothetical protein